VDGRVSRRVQPWEVGAGRQPLPRCASSGKRPRAAGPRAAGPRAAGPRATGPRATGPRATGPILTHQFDLGCYISSPHATNLCADCDADVHVLQATFLSSENSSCPICFRPRCVPCTAMMHSRGRPVREPAARHCKRCRPVAPGPQKPHVREKPLAPVPAFQGKVSPPTNPKKKAGK